ncbi:MAG: site-specific DNA-methyltransferase [Clostridia bacterium]|nr:site-specific DNA-methyltransferase [Clostridia bacterium]
MGNLSLKTVLSDAESALRSLPEASAALIIADPPFPTDNMSARDREEYFEFCRGWIEQSARVLREDGTIYVFMSMREISHIHRFLEEAGLTFNSWITRTYPNGTGKVKGFSNRHDDILMFTKSPKDFIFNLDDIRVPQKFYRSVNNMRGANPGNVWDFSGISRHAAPTQKPEALYERMILASSNPGDTVIDLFTGSGTGLRVCQQTGRNGIGIDDDPACIAATQRRLETEFTGFDSIDERMYRVPGDMNDPELREEYIENHIRWFLKNHPDAVQKFLDDVYVKYRRHDREEVQLSMFDL